MIGMYAMGITYTYGDVNKRAASILNKEESWSVAMGYADPIDNEIILISDPEKSWLHVSTLARELECKPVECLLKVTWEILPKYAIIRDREMVDGTSVFKERPVPKPIVYSDFSKFNMSPVAGYKFKSPRIRVRRAVICDAEDSEFDTDDGRQQILKAFPTWTAERAIAQQAIMMDGAIGLVECRALYEVTGLAK